MAPKDKLVKGQRPISSFFCKKPEGRQQPQQRHVSASADATEPPVKRQKREESSHKTAGDRHRANGASPALLEAHISHAADASEGEPIDLTGGPHQPSGVPSRAEEPGRGSRAHLISYNKEARHSRFQNKLVLGPASGLERDKTVVPQKTTPLEDQVYALKRKHPGILLLVEVCPNSCSFSHMVQLGQLGPAQALPAKQRIYLSVHGGGFAQGALQGRGR